MDGIPYEIVEFQHVKPGKGSAFVRTRIKNLLNDNVLDRTFKSGDKVGKPTSRSARCSTSTLKGRVLLHGQQVL